MWMQLHAHAIPCACDMAHTAKRLATCFWTSYDHVLAPYRSSDLTQPSPALLERFFGIHCRFRLHAGPVRTSSRDFGEDPFRPVQWASSRYFGTLCDTGPRGHGASGPRVPWGPTLGQTAA